MNTHPYSTADLAAKVGLKSAKAARKRARDLRLGINLEGRAGYRYSEADLQAFIDSMKPALAVKPRSKKRGRAA